MLYCTAHHSGHQSVGDGIKFYTTFNASATRSISRCFSSSVMCTVKSIRKVLMSVETRQNESISVKTLVIWLQYHHQYIYFYLLVLRGKRLHHSLSRHIRHFHSIMSSAKMDILSTADSTILLLYLEWLYLPEANQQNQ